MLSYIQSLRRISPSTRPGYTMVEVVLDIRMAGHNDREELRVGGPGCTLLLIPPGMCKPHLVITHETVHALMRYEEHPTTVEGYRELVYKLAQHSAYLEGLVVEMGLQDNRLPALLASLRLAEEARVTAATEAQIVRSTLNAWEAEKLYPAERRATVAERERNQEQQRALGLERDTKALRDQLGDARRQITTCHEQLRERAQYAEDAVMLRRIAPRVYRFDPAGTAEGGVDGLIAIAQAAERLYERTRRPSETVVGTLSRLASTKDTHYNVDGTNSNLPTYVLGIADLVYGTHDGWTLNVADNVPGLYPYEAELTQRPTSGSRKIKERGISRDACLLNLIAKLVHNGR